MELPGSSGASGRARRSAWLHHLLSLSPRALPGDCLGDSPIPRAASQTSPAAAAKANRRAAASPELRDRQRWWHWAWEAALHRAQGCSPSQSSLHEYKQLKDLHTLPTTHRVFRELLENHTCCQLTKPANYTIC